MHAPYRLFFAAFTLLSCAFIAQAADSWQSGSLNDLTSTSAGVMIRIDNGSPLNCQGSPYGWMLVRQEDKAMTAVVLTMWATGRRALTVYTAPNPGGYCLVTQIDPAD